MKSSLSVIGASLIVLSCGAHVNEGTSNAVQSSGGNASTFTSGGAANLAGSGNTGGTMIEHRTVLTPCNPLPLSQAERDAMVSNACAGWILESEGVQVDLILLIDRSVTMSEPFGASTSRWLGVRDGIARFFSEKPTVPATARFFEMTGPTGEPMCAPENYVASVPPLGSPLPANGSIIQAMDAASPSGASRPTAAALSGALQVAKDFKASTSLFVQPVVVLITAGNPNGCGDTLESLTAVAAGGVTNGFSTYVIQLGADFDLNPVAKAGSSGPVYLVDEGDVANSLYQALYDIVTPRFPGNLPISTNPDPAHPFDLSKSVVILPYWSGSAWVDGLVPHLNSDAECSQGANGGWHYDTEQTQMVLCPCTQVLNVTSPSAYFFCE